MIILVPFKECTQKCQMTFYCSPSNIFEYFSIPFLSRCCKLLRTLVSLGLRKSSSLLSVLYVVAIFAEDLHSYILKRKIFSMQEENSNAVLKEFHRGKHHLHAPPCLQDREIVNCTLTYVC